MCPAGPTDRLGGKILLDRLLDACIQKFCVRRGVEAFLDMPERLIDLLFRFLSQNDGRLSQRARTQEFSELTDEEAQRKGRNPLHLVSGWAARQRIVLDKSNGITAIPLLLQHLDLTGALVTMDAIGTRKPSRLSSGGGFVMANPACIIPMRCSSSDITLNAASAATPEVARSIRDGGGDYCLSLKKNWPAVDVEQLFTDSAGRCGVRSA